MKKSKDSITTIGDMSFIKVHGTDILPLRWIGNLLIAISHHILMAGIRWGTMTELIDNEEE